MNTARGEALSAELLARSAADQAARREEPADWSKIAAVDAANTAWLVGVVSREGWPLASAVGADAASAAWLLVQHSPAEFQCHVLPLMKAAVELGEAEPRNLAYLVDRIRTHDNLPQVYGTQYLDRGNGPELWPVEDPENLDTRRASVGLGPHADYHRQVAA